jgi:hypothetical protein
MDIGRIKHGEMTSQGYPSSSQSFGILFSRAPACSAGPAGVLGIERLCPN